ncbi:MAG: sigma-54 dependent transcriptional regulator [Pseudomonadota bacterium]
MKGEDAIKPVALVVDDEPDICELLAMTLQRMDIDARTVGNLADARRQLKARSFQLCLTDMRLPDGDGLELVEWMQSNAQHVPVAVITAHGNVEAAVRALKVGAFDFVSKPVDLQLLRRLVATAIKLKPAEAASAPATDEAAPADGTETVLLGKSAAMQRVRDLIAKVARSQAPVHITGESGTGKELVARLIHEAGPRKDQPFVPVNCGAIPNELMESEFFGHKKGSFTGAVSDKLGLFRSAEGGTLFLDEVADLPLHMQVKLLRVIQEKAVRPVGMSQEEPVDTRVVSATHKNLAALVTQGDFREDLYYRINVIELPVPPLRDRDGDVSLLATHILERLATENELPQATLSDDARAQLEAYQFPGNVRELENILERAVTLCTNDVIQAEDIQLRPGATEADTGTTTLEVKLEDMEREAIIRALEQTGNNKTAAAKLLGMSFRALRYRVKKLGLD